ncbi:MAG: BMP family ABC transporter substrate-binding protein [Lachnospiraceae bacterium]|nr:BMP family ABC transporter substrate-binding protein [Lachnospiraceae bacterium]
MKKFIAMLLSLIMVLALTACSSGKKSDTEGSDEYKDIKVGLICLHNEQSTYDKNFIDAMTQACQDLGIPESRMIIMTGIDESKACYEAAKDLVDRGCNIIFADSFGHEDYMIQAAREFPNVQFCHATGTKAHTEGLSNYHNAFASIYEGRYAAGVAAGLKLNEMIEANKITPEKAVMGYVGAYTYAEVVSGYTSFYLGAKSVCPTVTMKVQFTGSWYDETAEKEAAEKLISSGCVLISQHADSMGAPTACEKAGVPDVSYNGSTKTSCPNTFIISSRINWAPYYKYAINCVKDGKAIAADWTGGFAEGSVELSLLNENVAAAGTQAKIDAVITDLKNGSLKVFDTKTFTVDGSTVTTYMADIDTDVNYQGDTEVIKDGYFHESEFRSAPAFDLQIDGIELLNSKY